jgi:hypothetical protein
MGRKAASSNPDLSVPCADPQLIDRQWRAVGGQPKTTVARDALFGGPGYFRHSTGQVIYYCGSADSLRAFAIDPQSGKLSLIQQSAELFPPQGEGGSTPVVSSNGNTEGIVWLIERVTWDLVAYDAKNLATQLLRTPTSTHKYSPFCGAHRDQWPRLCDLGPNVKCIRPF